ncbi:MAG TPA: hypothetical protein VGM06_25230 [Polyangiaceae bacterium]|jgi:hypothetical protein
MRTGRYVASVVLVGWVGLLGWNSGCGSTPNGNGPGDGGGTDGTSSGGNGSGGVVIGDGPTNTNIAQETSKDGRVSTAACSGITTISGKVFDPAGNNPVYNVAVWVPYDTPKPMPAGLTCNCSELYTGGFVGSYALTDATGTFKISPAPAAKGGGSVPLVMQIGKWRSQTNVTVSCGTDNTIPDGTLRLPSRLPTTPAAATDPAGAVTGDLPSIAVSTGGADTLECLMTRMGVSENEYVGGASTTQRIHIFQGWPDTAPAMPTSPISYQSLWDTAADLSPYDAVLLSCEAQPTTMPNVQALFDYATSGGRVFASHYHYQWFLGQPWPNLATFYTSNANQLENPTLGTIPSTLPNGRPFPGAVAMKTWLGTVGALTPTGELSIVQARHNVDILPNSGEVGTPWMYFDPANSTFAPGATVDPVSASSVLYFSYDTMAQQGEGSCGRIVYSDLHVGGNSGDYGESMNASGPPANGVTPSGCNANVPLSNQEKALEFMLFDLTSCLAPPGSDAGTGLTIAQ